MEEAEAAEAAACAAELCGPEWGPGPLSRECISVRVPEGWVGFPNLPASLNPGRRGAEPDGMGRGWRIKVREVAVNSSTPGLERTGICSL